MMRSGAPIRVLYVDDNPHDRDLVRHALEREGSGFAVREAANREAFMEALGQGTFDLVLTDFNILGFEGLEVIRAVRRRYPEVPVIVLTGTGSEEIAVKALKEGADDYIIKSPSHIARLPDAVTKALEYHRARARLAEREANLSAVMENISEAVLVLDGEARILYANPAAQAQLGRAAEDLVGRVFPYPVTSEGAVEIDLPKRAAGPGTGEMHVARTSWNGAEAWLVSIRDITARKAAENALLQSERELRVYNRINEVFLTVPEEEVYTGVLRIILDAVHSRYGILGYIDDEGNWCCPGLTAEIREQCRVAGKMTVYPKETWAGIWGRAMKEGKSMLANASLAVPEGHLPITRVLDVPLRVGERLVGNLMVANKETDYTAADQQLLERIGRRIATVLYARMQLERERREKEKAQEQLLQAQKMESIGRLAGGIAHDFNNLLTIILGYGEAMLGSFNRQDPRWQDAKAIVDAAKRSAALTRQLLAFSRKQTLRPEVLVLNDVLRDLEKMLRRLIGEDIDLRLELAADLGPVKVDPGQMEQVLLNLVVNARDAMPGGGHLRIETANVELDEDYAAMHQGVAPGRYAMLAVTDTGCGMDRETVARIFEPFFTTKEKGKGTGLGLATVYGIVKQSGGNIWVYSEPGKGTTFKIYLPQTTEAMAREGEKRRETGYATGGEHILVVEDQEAVRGLVVTFLSRQGYSVRGAASAGEALLLVEKGLRPDLVITDVVMPTMNGKELAERLRSVLPGLKVLYMSGYPDDTIVHHGILEPGIPFIQKPFTSGDLAVKVREVLGAAPSAEAPARQDGA